MSEVSLKHKIALGLIPRIGDINARKLVSYFGSVESIFQEPYRNLIKIPGIGSGIAKYISDRSYLNKARKLNMSQKITSEPISILIMTIHSGSDNVMTLL